MQLQNKNYKIVLLSFLTTLSIVLSIIESYIPLINGNIPGFKLGLANIVILVSIYKYGLKEAFYISIIRIIVVGILKTGLFSIYFFFSLFGSFFSILAMYIVKKINLFSIIGISVVGSIFHSIGQIIASFIFLKNFNLIYYLPGMIIFSCITGIIIGIISKEIIKNIWNNL